MKSDIATGQIALFDEDNFLKKIDIEDSNFKFTVEKKPRIKQINREQILLRVVDVEKLVAEDHEVRAIWEFVGRLDLSKFYDDIEVVEGEAGRSAFDPQLKISLWIYSYSKGISSAREISKLCEYNPAYQWLTGMEIINHHTLSDFRVKHKDALDDLFIKVLGLLSAEGLITLERVMHDGTKVKAYASSDTFCREDRIRKHLEIAREQVELMEETNEEETSIRVAIARKRVLNERIQRLESALQEIKKIQGTKTKVEEKKEARVSRSDPAARIMKQSDGGYAPSYNMQISTDSNEKIIVGVGISQCGSDYGELKSGVKRIEKNMRRTPKQVVVDGGFVSKENIIAMNEREIDLIGALKDGVSRSAGQLNKRGIDPLFWPEKFCYDADTNTYTCPAGKVLKYEGKEERIGRTNYKYRACASDCEKCDFRERCRGSNNNVKSRAIIRGVNVSEVSEFIAKMETEEAKAIYKQRGAVAEFPNAWIKDKIKLRQFRLRGLLKVGMEAVWVCLAYNIQQWIRLCWNSG